MITTASHARTPSAQGQLSCAGCLAEHDSHFALCMTVGTVWTPGPTPDLLHLHKTEERVPPVQGIRELIGALQSRGIAVYLISGGFRELTLPIARELGVPCENVFANRMNWYGSCHKVVS